MRKTTPASSMDEWVRNMVEGHAVPGVEGAKSPAVVAVYLRATVIAVASWGLQRDAYFNMRVNDWLTKLNAVADCIDPEAKDPADLESHRALALETLREICQDQHGITSES